MSNNSNSNTTQQSEIRQLYELVLQLEKRIAETEKRIRELSRIPRPQPGPYKPIPYLPPERVPEGPYVSECSRCSLQLDKVMGYVCTRHDCPTGLGPTIC